MASVDLLFAAPPLTTGNLVFGDDGSNPATDAIVSGEIDAGMPVVVGGVALGINVGGGIDAGMPTVAGEMRYFTDTQRPLVSRLGVRFQEAAPIEAGTSIRQQDARPLSSAVAVRYADAVPLPVGAAVRFQDGQRARRGIGVRFQDGAPSGATTGIRFQDADRQRVGTKVRFQDALRAGAVSGIRFQDGIRVRRAATARYQDAKPFFVGLTAFEGYGKPITVGRTTRYQDAIKPPPGVSATTPPQPEDPCYVPDTDLLFDVPWSADTDLVFVCERHDGPGPGETVVVPIREVYMVLNDVALRRVEGDIPLPTFNMSLTLDVDSWTWFFSANLPASAEQYVQRNSEGDPVEVEANINGVAYRLLIESLTRDRTFGQATLRIGGRGISANLDAPIAPILSFGNTSPRTAQQLMDDVLTFNGVSLGWTVDWQIENWSVPEDIWTHQGSYITALQSIVGSVGGYLQPVPSGKTLRALLRYPSAPWAWSSITPDYELPSAVTTREGIEWTEKARYNRVFVSGTRAGVLGRVTRAGTAGELIAPMVTDSLIVTAAAARQRGTSILSDTGRIANVSLRLPVLPETGVIPPGKFVRYVDEGVTRMGITRGVSVDIAMPEVFQSILVETHE